MRPLPFFTNRSSSSSPSRLCTVVPSSAAIIRSCVLTSGGKCPPINLVPCRPLGGALRDTSTRSEEHTSELQSLMRISYAVFCLKKKTNKPNYLQWYHKLQTRPITTPTENPRLMTHRDRQMTT